MVPFVNTNEIKTTSYKVVLPFYIYAGFSFLAATIMLSTSASAFLQHYFHPHTLAITHMMALGWGTMIILGASHQLVPVLIEGRLYSEKLAYASFAFSATGIPFLIYSFYFFNMGWQARYGGELILLALLCYLVNLGISISKSKTENIYAIFVFTAAIWLLLAAALGLALIYNFTSPVFPKDSLHYLPLHAHLGIVGWFLLLVIGVGSRLIPMFLISKYSNTSLLWWTFLIVNSSLLIYLAFFLISFTGMLLLIPTSVLIFGIFLFAFYCYRSFKERIRRKVDLPMKVSLTSVIIMIIPLLLLLLLIIAYSLYSTGNHSNLVSAYGFVIFFGWITVIIFGMTFKTLPFISWNKVYHLRASSGKTPNPKDLFSSTLFKWMLLFYLTGFILFLSGIIFQLILPLNTGAFLLLLTAVFYNGNIFKIIFHKPESL